MLTNKGDKFTISNCSQIEEIRSFIKNNRNNPKIEGKTLDELYCLYIYLSKLYRAKYFSLPLQTLKWEHPDFVLDQQTGIEVVTSATQMEKHALAIMEKEYPKGSMLEIPYYIPGSSYEPRDGIRKPNEKLKHAGFGDYGKEKSWLDCVRQRLNEKICKLNKDIFNKYESNQLIIYDDTCFFPNVDYVIHKLKQECVYSFKVNFDLIHIVNVDNLFIFDVLGQCSRFNVTFDLFED